MGLSLASCLEMAPVAAAVPWAAVELLLEMDWDAFCAGCAGAGGS